MRAPRSLALPLALACCLVSQPASAFPVNYGNSYVPAPSHGLLLAIPTMRLDGQSMSGWGYVDLGVAPQLSVTVDSLYLNLPGTARDFGTTFVGLGLAHRPAPWLTLRLSPLVGLASGRFGQAQIAVRGYCDMQLPSDWTLYTMPAYYRALDGTGDSVRFNAMLEKRLGSSVSAGLELLSGTPSWEFGPDTRVAAAPSVTLNLGAYSLQASLRVPVLSATNASALTGPTGVFCLGYGW